MGQNMLVASRLIITQDAKPVVLTDQATVGGDLLTSSGSREGSCNG
ncbi:MULTISPECIES: hypothetical protein [unclassified Halomonas]|nr:MULTISPECIES: hypothetical protein [unclassified Halomonas]MBT2785964.1 hypothetical protein [Halomonas sp. ISL-106]MBT2796986.1 hypothetical protein [Halomonas sp. ISL-104]